MHPGAVYLQLWLRLRGEGVQVVFSDALRRGVDLQLSLSVASVFVRSHLILPEHPGHFNTTRFGSHFLSSPSQIHTPNEIRPHFVAARVR